MAHRIDLEFLLPRMRTMWSNLEAIGVAFIGPAGEIMILHKPTMGEFQDAARAGGVPDPRSWLEFYEATFGEYVEPKSSIQ